MFVSSVSQLENMSKDELWRIASNRRTAQSIRRAAIRHWLSLDESESSNAAVQPVKQYDFPRMLHLWPEDQPA